MRVCRAGAGAGAGAGGPGGPGTEPGPCSRKWGPIKGCQGVRSPAGAGGTRRPAGREGPGEAGAPGASQLTGGPGHRGGAEGASAAAREEAASDDLIPQASGPWLTGFLTTASRENSLGRWAPAGTGSPGLCRAIASPSVRGSRTRREGPPGPSSGPATSPLPAPALPSGHRREARPWPRGHTHKQTHGTHGPHTPTRATGRSLPRGGGALGPGSPQPAPGPTWGRTELDPPRRGWPPKMAFAGAEGAQLADRFARGGRGAASPQPGNCSRSVWPSAGRERQEHGLSGKAVCSDFFPPFTHQARSEPRLGPSRAPCCGLAPARSGPVARVARIPRTAAPPGGRQGRPCPPARLRTGLLMGAIARRGSPSAWDLMHPRKPPDFPRGPVLARSTLEAAAVEGVPSCPCRLGPCGPPCRLPSPEKPRASLQTRPTLAPLPFARPSWTHHGTRCTRALGGWTAAVSFCAAVPPVPAALHRPRFSGGSRTQPAQTPLGDPAARSHGAGESLETRQGRRSAV